MGATVACSAQDAAAAVPCCPDRRLSDEPRGRTRWLVSSTRAPLSSRYLSVGMAARMRVSSVMLRSLSSGTFRSARTCAQRTWSQQLCRSHVRAGSRGGRGADAEAKVAHRAPLQPCRRTCSVL